MQFKNYYRIPELKDEGVGGRTYVYGLIAAGKLTAVKNGRLTLVTGASVREYLENLPRAETAQKSA
jgi:excisionase family DNA binding protein